MELQQSSDDRAWSILDVTALRKQAAAGESMEEIAKVLKRSDEAVLAKATELGITLPLNSK